MPDDEGYLLPGELQLGSYAALEGDLGESLMGPLGFSAVGVDAEDEVAVSAPGFPSVPGLVVFVRGAL